MDAARTHRGPRRRAHGVAVLVTALVLALVPASGLVAQSTDPQVRRIAGEDRYGTAAEVASSFGAGVDRVFLATGQDFPDALAAVPVAARLGAPVLLVERDGVPAPTAEALERLDPAGITILGGPAAVSRRVATRVAQYTDGRVDRLAGRHRYATAAAIVDEYVDPGVPVAYVATGEGFADALAGGPAAAVAGGPMLLVRGDAIPAATRATLQWLRPGRIVVLGGDRAISPDVVGALQAYTDGDVVRMAGEDRYGTAAIIAARVFDGRQPTVWMTTGQGFPDALAGGVVAAMDGAPLVTVDPRCVPDVVLEQIRRMSPDTLVVLGGTRAVSRDAAELEVCSEPTRPRATTIQTGLAAPWDVVFAPGGRTFLTERDTGRVLERRDDGQLRTVRTFDVDADGEGGLLGLAASPTWTDDPWLYALFVSQAAQDQRIVRFRPNGADLQVVVSGLPHGGTSTHFAGRIEFGPDGMLYVGIGDVQDRSAPQDTSRLAGKILRYTPTGRVPADNPFGNPVWAYGFRDPQGLAWDGAGRMYASEFGWNTQDEIDRVVRGGNYGWPIFEGNHHLEPSQPEPSNHRRPLMTRHPEDASWSGAGTLVGGDIPAWEGDLFVAALRGQRLYRLDLQEGQVAGVQELLVGQYGRLRHVTQAPDGSLWVLTSNCDGRGTCPTGRDDRIVRLGR